MSRDSKTELNTLRGIFGLAEPEPEPEPTPFAQALARVMAEAVVTLRADGIIEVEDANVEALTQEIASVALEATSLKRLPLRLTKTLIHSDFVEEIYGNDTEISAALRPFLDRL